MCIRDSLYLASAITIHFPVQRGSVLEALLEYGWRTERAGGLAGVRLTDRVSYVTSPWFNGLDRLYPENYDGEFHLHLSHDQSVFISFTHFVLGEEETRSHDCLDFRVTALSHTWRK